MGENAARYLSKGRKCSVVGTIQIRTYEANDGSKRTAVDVVADDIEFLPSGDGQGAGYTQQVRTPSASQGYEQQGFTQVDEDELPF